MDDLVYSIDLYRKITPNSDAGAVHGKIIFSKGIKDISIFRRIEHEKNKSFCYVFSFRYE